MYQEIGTALTAAGKDNNVNVAATTGAGSYYCSGNDLSNFIVSPDKIPQMAKDAGAVLE